MNLIKSELVWCVDVDDTLVIWGADKHLHPTIDFVEPHSKDEIKVVVNLNNIRLLKEKKARGCFIVLWSQGGWEYAAEIATALKLNDFIDIVMTKPTGIIDDLHPSEWMPGNVNIPHTKNYKT
jgi:hypothetical protein